MKSLPLCQTQMYILTNIISLEGGSLSVQNVPTVHYITSSHLRRSIGNFIMAAVQLTHVHQRPISFKIRHALISLTYIQNLGP